MPDSLSGAELNDLIDMWKNSFRSAQKSVQSPVVTEEQLVRLEASSEDARVTRERHKSLAAIWSPHLAQILGPPMSDYIPSSLTIDSWSPENLQGYYDSFYFYTEKVMGNEIRANAFKLLAIISGTVYGIAAKSLIPNSSQADSQEFIEIAFQPNVLLDKTLFSWAKIVGDSLHGILDIYRWKDFILQLTTGISIRELNNTIVPERLREADKNIDLASSRIFGAQANGIFAVSDLVVKPSTQVDNVLRFHVGTGRILNLPVDENGFLQSSRSKSPRIKLAPTARTALECLCRQPVSRNPLQNESLRIDAEPDWAGDTRTILFSVRSGGVQIARLNLGQLIWRLASSRVSCTCTGFKHGVSVAPSAGWRVETLESLLRPSILGSMPCSASLENGDKILIDVYGDEMYRLFAVGLLHSRQMAISADCIACALEACSPIPRRQNESNLIIIG